MAPDFGPGKAFIYSCATEQSKFDPLWAGQPWGEGLLPAFDLDRMILVATATAVGSA
jgi:hypothetical protein